jgi:hypothetical protein
MKLAKKTFWLISLSSLGLKLNYVIVVVVWSSQLFGLKATLTTVKNSLRMKWRKKTKLKKKDEIKIEKGRNEKKN